MTDHPQGCLSDDVLFAFVQGQLKKEVELEAVEQHLAECAACRSVAAETARYFRPGTVAHPTPPLSTSGVSVGAARLALHPGTQVGRYRITEHLGSGGWGDVYRAHDPELDRSVALKLVRSDHSTRAGSRFSERLKREARAMARLSHPNVVTVYDVGTYGDQVFIVMELVEGTTLQVWHAEPPPLEQILRVYLQAAHGLAAAHKVGVVHRDFKPTNALVGRDGRVRVVDFGLAHALEDSSSPQPPEEFEATEWLAASRWAETATGGLVGTPAFMAPEQIRGEGATAKSDQFALCVALFQALTGKHPFVTTRGTTLEVIVGAMARCELILPAEVAIPPSVLSVLRRGLAREPASRFVDLNELCDELEQASDRLTRWRPHRRRLLLGGAAFAGAIALGAGGWHWSARSERAATGQAEDAQDARSPEPVPRTVSADRAATARAKAGVQPTTRARSAQPAPTSPGSERAASASEGHIDEPESKPPRASSPVPAPRPKTTPTPKAVPKPPPKKSTPRRYEDGLKDPFGQ